MLSSKILVIDDERAVKKTIEIALEDSGYELFFADNGKEGLQVYNAHHPALTILDLKMPIMDGVEFLDHIKSSAYSCPVIVLTGHGTDEDVEKCYNLGASAFLRKPFNFFELSGMVKNSIALNLYEEELHRHRNYLEELVEERTLKLKKEIAVRKQAEEQLRLAKEKAEAANVAKSQFLNNVTHELRTPLNAIIGFTKILMETDLSKKQHGYLERVNTSGIHLLAQINEILDLTKIESGKLDLMEISFHLRDTVEKILKPIAISAQKKNLKFSIIIGPDIPDDLLGDPHRLHQLLVNLVNNAIKFTNAGEIEVSVTVENTTKDLATLHFSVRDTGIGIPKDHQEMIFDSFTQVDGSITRQYGGTGLGITIAKRLVELMGGKIWVESEEEAGSNFHFVLPFKLRKHSGLKKPPV